jgi:hypothetical protein
MTLPNGNLAAMALADRDPDYCAAATRLNIIFSSSHVAVAATTAVVLPSSQSA